MRTDIFITIGKQFITQGSPLIQIKSDDTKLYEWEETSFKTVYKMAVPEIDPLFNYAMLWDTIYKSFDGSSKYKFTDYYNERLKFARIACKQLNEISIKNNT